ncbi:hypothetical protein ILUMI_17614 [Ignelater luminosus]|uniref:Uncharacterized protein n=1 Tax=Ignelater luminosus TaxID=2038154 RepID=A0A8K0CLE5_IGNLU|nr:hypothetical protein ILUMI_17614 [Ignelater luminosus]
MIYDLDEELPRYTDLINIECESDDVYASGQSIEHEANSKIVPTNPLQDVNEPCCCRELNKTPIAARQTVRANVIETSPTDEKELETVESMYSDDSEDCCSKQCNEQLPKNLVHLKAHRLMRADNVEEKEEKLNIALKHINRAKTQREFYKMWCHQTTAGGSSSFLVLPFDFEQNISYPNSPQQVGSAYFKVGRKCCIFGINNEKPGTQTNFVIDRANDIGKGQNATVTMLHHYLETHPSVDTLIQFADSCDCLERQWHLYKHIKPLCIDCDKQDLVASKPEAELNKNKRKKKE